MLKSKNQVIINSSNLQLICNFEARYSRVAGCERVEVKSYMIVDSKGNIVNEHKYSNNLCKLIEGLDIRSLESELDDIKFCLENGYVKIIEDIMYNNSQSSTRIQIKNLKCQIKKENEKKELDRLNKENKELETELIELCKNNNVRINKDRGSKEITLYEILDSAANHLELKSIISHPDGHKYLKEIKVFKSKNRYDLNRLNDNLKSCIEYVNKITISSDENEKLGMNLQLLASKKESKLNVIKQLEDVLNGFNNALDELYSIDCIYDNDDFNNINNFIEEYKNKNNILDDYFNINDIIDNLTKQIEDIKDLIELDVRDLYKNELSYHNNKYGKIEVTESKNEIKEDLNEDIKEDIEINLIELSTLSEQRKTIKNNCDKIYKILESGDIKNSCLSETYFQLNSLNENIKSNKKIKKDQLIKNMNDITYNLRRIMEDENINKRRYKTISNVHDTINDI